MRMKELTKRSGLPRTTIHYYLRIGLLHAPEKEAVNSAIYDQSHLDRLALITRLRSEEGGSLPVFHVRRVLELVEDGVPLEGAIALQQAVLHAPTTRRRGDLSASRMAKATGLPRHQIDELEGSGLLSKEPGSVAFDQDDLEMASGLKVLLDLGVDRKDLEWILARIREVSAFEMAIAARLVEGVSPARRAQILLELQKAVNVLHHYALRRSRQAEILGLHKSERKDP